MRILVRANAHRRVLDAGHAVGVEVAASPDTPGRPERWSWHIRLLETKMQPHHSPGQHMEPRELLGGPVVGVERTLVELGAHEAFRVLEVQVDPTVVTAHVELLGPGDEEQLLERTEEELMALVASSGEVVLENRHRLLPGDAIVLTGDDPLAVCAHSPQGSLVVIRIRAPHQGPVSWVP